MSGHGLLSASRPISVEELICGPLFTLVKPRDGSRTAATSKIELFVIIVNDFQPLTIITKCSILDVEAVLDSPLESVDYLRGAYSQR